MRWSVIKVIWFREVRDQLRDRRTAFMLFILPALLYPGLGALMFQLLLDRAERPVAVGVAGAEHLNGPDGAGPAAERPPFALAELPPLLDPSGTAFDAGLFADPDLRSLLTVRLGGEAELDAALAEGDIQAYLVFTPQLVADLKAGRQVTLPVRLRGWRNHPPIAGDEPTVMTDDSRGQSAHERLKAVLARWSQAIAKKRLEALGAPPGYAKPVVFPALRLKGEQIWSRVFPFLIVMMSLTGALYPAIDVCAGEKERGTMETLLISPASRGEIVCGKFLTVWSFSAVMALLNLASLALTAWHFSGVMSGAVPATPGGGPGPMPAPGAMALVWCVVLLVPLAAFFSAVSLALAVYARSTKEGQYYLMPLMMLTLLLIMIAVVPGAELSPFYSVVPVTGAALLLQDLMTAPSPDRIPWLYIAPVLLPMGAYCYLALNWAIQQFKREEVLFREAERLDLGLMVRRVFREKEPLPSAAMAMTLFGMLLAFGWLLRTSGTAAHLLAVTAVHQLAFVATPALMMGLLLTSRPLLTLRLAPPAPRFILLSLGLAACLHVPLALTTGAIIRQFPHIAEQAQRFVEHVIDLGTPFWLYLLIMAALPAVCEELAFRGFIFSGLVRRFANGRAVVVASSLLFALYHMNALQLIPTFLLGLVLGLLAQRSGSLLPGLLLHFIHNGLAFAVSYYGYRATKTGTAPPAWLSEDTVYNWPVAALGAGLGLVLLVVLYRQPIPPLPRAPADRPALEPE